MQIGYIYKIVNDINEKVYVGQTATTIVKRWTKHKQCRKCKKYEHIHFYRALNKYGVEHFTPIELEKVEANSKKELKEKLDYLEKYYIKLYKSFENGYNSTLGGDGGMLGFKHSQESKLKMSKSHKGVIPSEETRKKMSIAQKGKTFSEETKKILSNKLKSRGWTQEAIKKSADKHIGLKMSEETKKKIKDSQRRIILQYDLQNKFIAEWDSIKDAAISIGLKSTSSIRQCLIGKSKQSHGYIWKYKDNLPVKEKKQKRAVLQYDLKGNFIKEFNSLKEASESCRTTDSAIGNCCKGKYKSAGGYIWKYKD